MSTSDRTHDPLGLGERGEKPPTRYDSEGMSLPERGSGYVTPATPEAPEPEKLVIPPQAVSWLIMKALTSDLGDAWLRGFITAHGEPDWFLDKRWGLKTGIVEIVKTPPPGMNGTP